MGALYYIVLKVLTVLLSCGCTELCLAETAAKRELVFPLSLVSSAKVNRVTRAPWRRDLAAVKDYERMPVMPKWLEGGSESAGLFAATFWIGSPPNPYKMIVDTGSFITWIFCSSCDVCKGLHPLYDPENSETAAVVPCNDSAQLCDAAQHYASIKGCWNNVSNSECYFDMEYGDDGFTAINATLRTDNLSLSHHEKVPIPFGCVYDSHFTFKGISQYDGLAGLSPRPLSLPHEIARSGRQPNAFITCLGANEEASGYLALGEAAEYVAMRRRKPFQFVNLTELRDVGYYGVPAMGILVAGQKLDIPLKSFKAEWEIQESTLSEIYNTVFDTGTTRTLFVTPIYRAFISAVNASIRPNNVLKEIPVKDAQSIFGVEKCWKIISEWGEGYIESIHALFPNASITFEGGLRMDWKPRNFLQYFRPVSMVCVGVEDVGPVQLHSVQIIGNLGLRRHELLHDNTKRRIGWRRSSCKL